MHNLIIFKSHIYIYIYMCVCVYIYIYIYRYIYFINVTMKTVRPRGYHHNSILCLSCSCEIWALCVSWISYDHLYYAPSLAFWALFDSLVPAMFNHISCAQKHELLQRFCGDNREGTLYLTTAIFVPLVLGIKQIW